MGHFHLQHHVEGLDASEMMRVQRKSGAKKHGVKSKDRKRASDVGDSGWAAGNTSIVC